MTNCVGTVLSGNYPYGPDSRLISPVIDLPQVTDQEEIVLRFQQLFSYSSSDRGEIQIQLYENESWSNWTILKTINQHTPVWHNALVELSEFAGKRVRLSFYHIDQAEDPEGIVRAHTEDGGSYSKNDSFVCNIFRLDK